MDKRKYYSSERNHQILISLLKQSGIRKVIASPGATNVSFVGSLQGDPFFEMYSCVDERSAAHMACGLAAESGEPVVLSCTGATSSRNYIPAMTRAYYEKLPILAVTSTQDVRRIGHLIAQVTDRSVKPTDSFVHAEYVPTCTDAVSEWDATIRINRAILALHHKGGGPVHINLATTYSKDFSVKSLPKARLIRRITTLDRFPALPIGRIAIWAGSHLPWSNELRDAVDRFCTKHNAVVFGGHCSNGKSPFCVNGALLAAQESSKSALLKCDLLISIGEVSGDYANMRCLGPQARKVWRVNEDGELRDQFRNLTHVFEMREEEFFTHYAEGCKRSAETNAYLEACHKEYDRLYHKIPDRLPLSNLWIAHKTSTLLPEHSVIHFGILNSLRAWDMFEIPQTVASFVNSGGFGIDGVMSSCVGGALAQPDRLHFLVIGDLAFFYDMNVTATFPIPSNMRILLVNNGKGTEFRNYGHNAAIFGDAADRYMAAGGHNGNKSTQLVRHWAANCGMNYLSASTRKEVLSSLSTFIHGGGVKPILFEVFTTSEDESQALYIVTHLDCDKWYLFKKRIHKMVALLLPRPVKDTLKKLISKF